MRIRRAILDLDLEALHKLNQLISPDESIESLRNDLKNLRQGDVFVAEEDCCVLGFISVAYPFWNQVALTFHLVVLAEHRNCGIGTALIKHVIDTTKSSGIRFLTLRTAAWNKQALTFYQRIGFVSKAVFSEYFGEGNDMVWLQIDLRDQEQPAHDTNQTQAATR